MPIKAMMALIRGSHSNPGETPGFLAKPKSPARLMIHIRAQPQNPTNNQLITRASAGVASSLVSVLQQ